MRCQKCGNEIEENAQFCPNCGTAITEITKETVEPQKFSFCKNKMMGTVTYKTTTTEVLLTPTQLAFHQTTKKIFCKERVVDKAFALSSVQSAKIRKMMDFWDTLYGVIFLILGIFQPVLLLMSALCLWCGYGKEIEIISSNDKIKIPLAGNKESADALLAICNRQR